jgi:hypothetical protein
MSFFIYRRLQVVVMERWGIMGLEKPNGEVTEDIPVYLAVFDMPRYQRHFLDPARNLMVMTSARHGASDRARWKQSDHTGRLHGSALCGLFDMFLWLM